MEKGDGPADVPLFWSQEGRTAEIVRCHLGHLAARETFEAVGGCPYCNHTPGERVAAVRAMDWGRRKRPAEKTATADRRYFELVGQGTELVNRARAIQFELGDLALDVEPLGEGRVQEPSLLGELAKAVGMRPASLARYRRVAAAWPQDKRNTCASWSVHAILAGHPDRFDIINHPPQEPKPGWTCEAARTAMRSS
ncbi:DUF6192 family protein [Streptomyces sp. NPDC006632]|uniref:DUF6192 family protein n=1 Tax=Streptomyces sp. NPDC006632 TaxID=3157182 RepID=UPI0033B6A48B